MGKILVVVYSYTGTSRRLAQLLCSQMGWPMGEITETRSRAGVLGSLKCIVDSVFGLCPPVLYVGPEPRDFQTVVLIAPIWAYRLAAPMRSFVAERSDRLPRVAVVAVMGGKGGANAASEIGELLGRAPLLATSFTTREVEDGSCASRLEAFGATLQASGTRDEPVRPAMWSPSAG
ncbi:MAG: flavodoxin [Pseudomonadota bacterium]